MTKTHPYDTAAAFLETDADVSAYMNEALETGDAAFIAHALGVVARARGMTQIARDAGLSAGEPVSRAQQRGKPRTQHPSPRGEGTRPSP